MATINDSSIRAIKQRFGIVGESAALIAAIRRAMLVAPIDLSVLIIGESGSGKESFPKIIHESSPRKHKKYIAVNCGAIPEGTIDSELFGHVKGSFTGAIADHKGYFEEADGGVIFLDEVAEMPMSTQARLLRVLENGEYLRVGDSTVRKTNIRVVAATTRTCCRLSRTASSARTCTTVSQQCRSTSPLCANAAMTSCYWPGCSCATSSTRTAPARSHYRGCTAATQVLQLARQRATVEERHRAGGPV